MTDNAPGWDAIDAAFGAAFPSQQPQHWGTDGLPGQAIYGLSAYRDGDDWFFVTYGLSELFAKESDDPTTNGWGFELTMRTLGASEPPLTGGDPPTQLTAVAFAIDPVLGSIETPNGHLDFLELVGITSAELDRMKSSSTASVIAELVALSPTLVTDPAR